MLIFQTTPRFICKTCWSIEMMSFALYCSKAKLFRYFFKFFLYKRITLCLSVSCVCGFLIAEPCDSLLSRIQNRLDNDQWEQASSEMSAVQNNISELTCVIYSYLQIAHYHHQKRQVEEATKTLDKIQRLVTDHDITDDSIQYQFHLIRGSTFMRTYDSENAIPSLSIALRLYNRKNYRDSIQLASIYGNLANAHYIRYRYDSSGKYYRRLIPLLKSQEVASKLGVPTYWSIALFYNSRGLVDSAMINYEKVLDLIGSPTAENVRVHLAMNTNRSGDLRKVFRIEEAYDIVSENEQLIRSFGISEDEQVVIDFRYELAQVFRDMGRNRESIDMFRKVYEKETALYGADHINNAYNFVGVGIAYKNLGLFDSALHYYDQAIRIARVQVSELSYYEGTIHELKGDLYQKMGLYQKALLSYKESAYRSRGSGDPNQLGLVAINLSLGQVHYHLNHLDSAKYYASLSSKYNGIEWFGNEARPINGQVVSLGLTLENILLRVLLGLEEGNQDVNELAVTFLMWRDRFDLNIKNAEDLTQLVEVQKKLIEVLLNSEMDEDILIPLLFKLHESNQNKLLVNELEFKHAKRSVLPEEKRLTLSSLDQLIYWTRNQLFVSDTNQFDKIEIQLETFRRDRKQVLKDLRNSNPAYFELRYGSLDNIISQVKSLCGTDKVAIKFIETSSSFVAIVVDHERSALYRLDREMIDSLSTAIVEQVNRPDLELLHLGQYQEVAHSLFNELFETYYEGIRSKDLIIFPDGPLRHVPIEALLVSKNPAVRSYKKLDYLVIHHGVSYLHSVQATTLSSQTKAKGKDQIAFFEPQYEDNLKLPWTEQELASIRNFEKVRTFRGDGATKDNFFSEGKKYKYIHFAGHGQMNDHSPILSHLKFTEMDGERSDLTSAEIYKLDLTSEMVVLSACETGIGTYRKGEGMLSLSRAFLFAGAKSVVMSLWQVNDLSTSVLMAHFYQHLSTGATKDQALQQAKIQYLRDSRPISAHPFYWSPLVVNGNIAPIHNQGFTIPWFFLLAMIVGSWFLLRKVLKYRSKMQS